MKRDTSDLLKVKIAHRGLHDAESEENSLSAFQKAIDKGYAIELDIHLSSDKEVVVFHDDNLKRVTGKDAIIHDLTLKELQSLKLGKTNETIPTFKEVLKLVNGQTPILIEFKTMGKLNQELVDKAYDILKDYKGKFFVQSFDPFQMIMYKKKDPSILRGQLVCGFENESMPKIEKFLLRRLFFNFLVKPDFITTEFNYYPKFMQRMHKRKTVVCWTVRSKKDQEKAKVFDNIIFENFIPEDK